MRKSILSLNLMFFILIAFGGISQETKNAKIIQFVDSLTEDEFSGAILVAKNDTVIKQKVSGLANIEFDIKNQIDTKFNIASITKLMTAIATLQLYEQGRVELNQPIGKYLKDYPNKVVRDSVNIHQLLTHTAGTPNFYLTGFLDKNPILFKKVDDFLPFFVNDTLLFKPGSDYHYNAAGFVILGLLIEEISGLSYYDYMEKNIFKPAGMDSTHPLAIDSIVVGKASGYTSFFGEKNYLKKNDYYLSNASPGGFYYSTVMDLFKFSKALRNHILLTQETTELMLEPKVKGYNTHLGYGIDIDLRYNQPIIGHSGGWYGVRAELMDFLNDNYTIIVLSNIDDNGSSGASKVIDHLRSVIAK